MKHFTWRIRIGYIFTLPFSQLIILLTLLTYSPWAFNTLWNWCYFRTSSTLFKKGKFYRVTIFTNRTNEVIFICSSWVWDLIWVLNWELFTMISGRFTLSEIRSKIKSRHALGASISSWNRFINKTTINTWRKQSEALFTKFCWGVQIRPSSTFSTKSIVIFFWILTKIGRCDTSLAIKVSHHITYLRSWIRPSTVITHLFLLRTDPAIWIDLVTRLAYMRHIWEKSNSTCLTLTNICYFRNITIISSYATRKSIVVNLIRWSAKCAKSRFTLNTIWIDWRA